MGTRAKTKRAKQRKTLTAVTGGLQRPTKILMTKSADNLIYKGWIIDFAIQEKIHVKKDNVEEEID